MNFTGHSHVCLSGISSNQLAAPAVDVSRMDAGHFVQFYESDEFLVESVSSFIGAVIGTGESAVIIATPEHCRAIDARLTANGFGLGTLKARERYVALDAAETLSQFMVAGAPDPTLFRKVIGGLVARLTRGGQRLRAFGEMVALLCADGNEEGAIQLEELWNDLAEDYSFTLFCAYPLRDFAGENHQQSFAHICSTHSHVIPTENYTAHAKTADRLRAISFLQQKASSLEAEIAERKRTERAWQEQNTKLTMAVSLAGLGVWEVVVETNEHICCDQTRALFGVNPGEPFPIEEFFNRIHPEDRQLVRCAGERAIAERTNYQMEFRVIHSGGEVRWLAAMGRSLHDGRTRMLGVVRDITERKRSSELLEQTVAERTAKLEEIITELESFSYTISHDMRSPLRSMRGFSDILLQECSEKLDAESLSHLHRISSSASRMDRLIQDVLTFSKLSREEFPLKPISLDELVRGIIESYPNLQSATADIRIEGVLPVVLGSEAPLTQCISNLLGNALKFVEPGRKSEVKVSAKVVGTIQNRSEASPCIRLSIQDNGIGIPLELQSKVFGIFERLSKDYDGTGIGLAIVKKAAERMGGRVGLCSEPGRGSTFWVELPAPPQLPRR